MDVAQIIESILALCGGIGIIAAGATGISKFVRPALKLAGRVSELERHDEADYKRMERIEAAQKAICKGTLALLLHAESGNDTGTMRSAREELADFLIER